MSSSMGLIEAAFFFPSSAPALLSGSDLEASVTRGPEVGHSGCFLSWFRAQTAVPAALAAFSTAATFSLDL